MKRKHLFCTGFYQAHKIMRQRAYKRVWKYMHSAHSITCKRNEYWPTIFSATLQSLWIYNDGVGFKLCSNGYKIKLQSRLTVDALLYVNVKVGWSKC